MDSQTPNIKCPRSGRVLTPLSLDYWRFKKTLKTVLSSESENEDCDAGSLAACRKKIMSYDRCNDNRASTEKSGGRAENLKGRRRGRGKENLETSTTPRKNKELGQKLATPLTHKPSNVATRGGENGTTCVSSVGKDVQEDIQGFSIGEVERSSKIEHTPSAKSGSATLWPDTDADKACASDRLCRTPEEGPRELVDTSERYKTVLSPMKLLTSPETTPARRQNCNRKAWMALFSKGDEARQRSTASADSGRNAVKTLENELASIRLKSSSSSTSSLSSDKVPSNNNNSNNDKDVSHEVVEISSDEDDLPPLAERGKVVPPKTPMLSNVAQKVVSSVTPAHPKDVLKLLTQQRLTLTEPRKRVYKTTSRSATPASEKPTKTRTPRIKSQLRIADESFDERLDKLCNGDDQLSDLDETQGDPNDTAVRWEITNKKDRHFVESLSENVPIKQCHPEALHFRQTSFMSIREELTEKLYELFHRTVFQNRFTEPIPVSWSGRLLTTAGLCSNKTHSNGRKYSEIELSTKVVDRPDRLRDTLIHEMCHAGAWIIHGYPGQHGPLFKFWGQRGAELLGLKVSRCHAYTIETKYVYKCQQCGYEVGRHSKSLDTERFVCGRCKGRFALTMR
ncbi:HMG box-containing protein C19G7.04-like [Tropilaelaps mercedesae]|uniref:HMG box-containing protein C19G7.04-like n=1 Tax=Tropilaelaps mercedesae TaxID=418985 RepID=A0A1V9X7L4_9ACAR|nr:HMG box-containing protein C19G7.04-like [Tropilaelaps mercedesae]